MYYYGTYCCILFLISFFVCEVEVLNNGLALTPPMGWMSWGYYLCADDCSRNRNCLNEKLIMSVADHFYNNGYLEAGYEYIIIDDCWSERKRDKNGRLVANKKRFPRGMKFLADYIHSKDLKFGMYTNIADITCAYYPGSKNHFALDAKTFAEWEIDYIKVDGCFVGEEYLNVAYKHFGYALNITQRPIVYSCSWPYYIKFIHNHTPNFESVAKHCNQFRTYHDIFANWGNIQATIKYFEGQHSVMEKYHGPGQWFDPDMILLGTGRLPMNKLRIQMAVYAMLSAPILISCDLNTVTGKERNLMLNPHVLAIAQDRLGYPAKPYKIENNKNIDVTLFVKRHYPVKAFKYWSHSFAIVNYDDKPMKINLNPTEYGLNWTDGYSVMNIFKRKYISNYSLNDVWKISVPALDVLIFSCYPL